MGWSSGTDIFDKVMKHVLDQNYTRDVAYGIGSVLMDALDDQDWDTHNESEFFEHPVLRDLFEASDGDCEDGH